MDMLQKQIRRARRRLVAQRFLGVLPWCLFAALVVASAIITLEKFYPLGVGWTVWLTAAAVVGLVAALLATFWRTHTALDAALEIDRRFGLKERISSAYSLDGQTADTAVGQALLADAVRRLERLEVAARFQVRPSRWSWLPLLPATAAFLVVLLLPTSRRDQAVATTEPQVAKQVQASSEQLQRKLAERMQRADEQGLEEAKELFKRLEQGAVELSRADRPERKQALVKLNDLARQVEERQRELAANKEMANRLAKLGNLDRGPADRFSQALQKGDFKQAAEELEKLKKQLEAGELNDEQREQLARQLDQMKDKLREMADARKALEDELRKRAEAARAAGRNEEAEALEERLAELAKQGDRNQLLEQMAQQLGNCAECMNAGDAAGAMAGFEAMQAQLGDLQQQLDELAMLDAALNELADAKQAMNCGDCEGLGCGACMRDSGRPGDALGEGRGFGARPEAEHDTSSYDTRVRQQVGPGAADITDLVEGPNVAGQIQQEVTTALEAARTQASDPLTTQRLPRGYRDHAKTYFDSLREDRQ